MFAGTSPDLDFCCELNLGVEWVDLALRGDIFGAEASETSWC